MRLDRCRAAPFDRAPIVRYHAGRARRDTGDDTSGFLHESAPNSTYTATAGRH